MFFRSFIDRTSGQDQVNKVVLIMHYGIYTGINVNMLKLIWDDFVPFSQMIVEGLALCYMCGL